MQQQLCAALYHSRVGRELAGTKSSVVVLLQILKHQTHHSSFILSQLLLTLCLNVPTSWEMMSLETADRESGTHFWRGEGEQGKFWQLCERLIRSAKTALCAVLSSGEVTDEELNTALVVVEGLLNSRPISYVSADSADLEPLTPAHFLMGDKYRCLAPVPENMHFNSRWHHLQGLLDSFWSRFMKEVVPNLQKYQKWSIQKETPEVGDVVIVLEERIRGKWPLGRIESLSSDTSIDGLPRTAMVRFSGTLLKRPIHKIVALPKLAS